MPASRQAAQESARVVSRQRIASVASVLTFVTLFSAVSGQLITLGLSAQPTAALAAAEPVATTFSRPDIVDRHGRLLATDLEVPSLFADAALVIDRDEVAEKLRAVIPDLDTDAVRKSLADRSRRFVWLRRGVSPQTAQRVHDLGLPGLEFRYELKRAYPAGELAGHVIGSVNVDNKGMSGIERYIDEHVGVTPVAGTTLSTKPPVRLSIDLGTQHIVENELSNAIKRYQAKSAAGLVFDITTGELIASASLPGVDPLHPEASQSPEQIDRIAGGTYELGSVFKTLTVAMALDEGLARPETRLDVTKPLNIGRHTIRDFHNAGRPLTVTEIFTHSSNIGAGMLALKAGPQRLQRFFSKLGLLTPIESEAGRLAPPQIPERWGEAEVVTTSYGHGLAVAPLQFASAAAALFNGGKVFKPTLIKTAKGSDIRVANAVSDLTRRRMQRLFRLNVVAPDGTGKRADVEGYRVGGKTGTAEIATGGRYKSNAVISSFLAAFPMDNPRYLTFVLLFEPKGTAETAGYRTASRNAAPVTARIIKHIAPLLGIVPMEVAASQ